jgi:modulator of FtsH protease HflC
LGIDVIDVRIKKIDVPETVTNTVYQQMRAERERVATGHRSQGRADAEAIEAQADANVTVAIANAKAEAAKIRAQGDALAAGIYSDAYSKDPEFYAFYRSMLAYQQSFNTKQDIIVLKPDSQFFKYFNNENGKQAEPKKEH